MGHPRQIGGPHLPSDARGRVLEQKPFGTSQRLLAVIDSDSWGFRHGRGHLLDDERGRMKPTRLLIDTSLGAHRR